MEEMSTREIIETIVKGKSTIVAFTVICNMYSSYSCC